MIEQELQEAEVQIQRAQGMVSALCKPRGSEGAREWVMRIPAQPDDPDLVIDAGLRGKEKLIAEVRCLQRVLIEGHIDPCNEERDTEHTLATTLRHIAEAIETGTGRGWEDWLVEKAKDIDAAFPPREGKNDNDNL